MPSRVLRRFAAPRLAVLLALVAALSVASGLQAATAPAVPPLSTNGNPPACRITDVQAKFTSTASWSRTLVDWRYRLSKSYAPPDLVPVGRAGLTGGGYVRRIIIPDLKAMTTAARAAGARLAVASAYRSYRTQVSTFASWVARLGYQSAILGSARPGHSEHQLGTTIDFKSYGGADPWSIRGYDFGKSRAGAWLKANAWRYGFALSYPRNKRTEVCYGYEPWHYRYFGKTVARSIRLSGLTTRVWLWRHGNSPIQLPQPTPTPRPSPTPSPTPPPTATPSPTATPTDAPTPTPTTEPTPTPTTEPTPTPPAP